MKSRKHPQAARADRIASRLADALRGAKLVRGLSRRAPELKALPTEALERAVERCETAAGFWTALDLWGRERDPLFTKLARTLRRWIRVETLLGRLEAHNRRVAEKRAVLATEDSRAELLEALGGVAAMERWERAWEAAGAVGELGAEHKGIEFDKPQASAKPKHTGLSKPVQPEWYRRQKAGLAWRFRLAGVPRSRSAGRNTVRGCRMDSRQRGDDRIGGDDRRRLNDCRIAVWPEELGYAVQVTSPATRPARRSREREMARFRPRPTGFTPRRRVWETSSALQSGRASFGSPNGGHDRLFPP